MKPNFLYIGTSKAGSSWIYEILREHPEIYVPPAKDIQFFDYNYERGIEWYLKFFRPGSNCKAIGEVGHNYFLDEVIATRIQKHFPSIKLFCSLREPFDQILSTYLYRRNVVLDQTITFEDFAFQEEVLHLNDYYFNLLPFYRLFPKENILVLFFDDLKKNPALFLQRIYDFLGVNSEFVPVVLDKRVLPASTTRIRGIGHIGYQIGSSLRQLGFANLVGRIKTSYMFRKFMYKPLEEKPKIPKEIKQKIWDYYRDRYKLLPEQIGQPLPEGWPTLP